MYISKSATPAGSSHLIATWACLLTQSALVPDRVRVKVSQFTPSTHVVSLAEAPPDAVPSQVNGAEVGVTDPEFGFAAKVNTASRAAAEQSANAANTRGLKIPDSEACFFFMMKL